MEIVQKGYRINQNGNPVCLQRYGSFLNHNLSDGNGHERDFFAIK